MTRRKWLPLAGGIALLIVILIVLGIYGCTKMNSGNNGDHYVRGIDVSAYQGQIDWEVIAGQNIDFAYIKATEGHDYVDNQFKANWDASQKTDLKVGAYHFLNFDTTGTDQANNFIANVPVSKKNLPPVVDLELYGQYEENPPSQDQVKVILDAYLKAIEDHYGVKPIIYTSQRVFNMYIGTNYTDYKVWIVDLDNSWPEKLPNGQTFTFWQYTQRGILDGYDGNETFVDFDLYKGTYDEFLNEFF